MDKALALTFPIVVKTTFEKLTWLDSARSVHHDRFGMTRLADKHASTIERYEAGTTVVLRYSDSRNGMHQFWFSTDETHLLPFTKEELIKLGDEGVIDIDVEKLRLPASESTSADEMRSLELPAP